MSQLCGVLQLSDIPCRFGVTVVWCFTVVRYSLSLCSVTIVWCFTVGRYSLSLWCHSCVVFYSCQSPVALQCRSWAPTSAVILKVRLFFLTLYDCLEKNRKDMTHVCIRVCGLCKKVPTTIQINKNGFYI